MSLHYKKSLVIGATSGIGWGLVRHLLDQGLAVIAVGRRQERLSQLAQLSPRIFPERLDIGDLEHIEEFAKRIIQQHPDLDSIFLNAGVQYVMHLAKPQTVIMHDVEKEMRINYLGPVALVNAFARFFLAKAASHPAYIFTTSNLMTVPYPMVFNYCASKSALRSYILSLREQLRETGVNVVELVAPLVQTELHAGQPGWDSDFNVGISVDEFCEAALQGIAKQQHSVAIGFCKPVFDELEQPREDKLAPQYASIRKALGKAHQL